MLPVQMTAKITEVLDQDNSGAVDRFEFLHAASGLVAASTNILANLP